MRKVTINLPDKMPRPLTWIWYGFVVALLVAIAMACVIGGCMVIGLIVNACESYGWLAGGPVLAAIFIFIGYLIETNESK